MPQTRNASDKKLLSVVEQLADQLINHKYDDAWPLVGQLNNLLKNKDDLTLPGYMLDMLEQHVRSYYRQNDTVQQAHKVMSAIGRKLAEFQ